MPRESTVETRLRNKIEKIGGYCLKWVCSGHAGVPDRIILLPRGRIYFVELKAEGKKATRIQKVWLSRLQHLGFDATCVVGAEEVDAFIRRVR